MICQLSEFLTREQLCNEDFHLGQVELYDFLQKYSAHYTKVPPFLEAQFLCAVAYGANGQPSLFCLGVVELKFQ